MLASGTSRIRFLSRKPWPAVAADDISPDVADGRPFDINLAPDLETPGALTRLQKALKASGFTRIDAPRDGRDVLLVADTRQ